MRLTLEEEHLRGDKTHVTYQGVCSGKRAYTYYRFLPEKGTNDRVEVTPELYWPYYFVRDARFDLECN